MPRRALLIGMSTYTHDRVPDLPGCETDVAEMQRVLSEHENCSRNYKCNPLVSKVDKPEVSQSVLRSTITNALDYEDEVLIYFSGHGTLGLAGGYWAAQDSTPDDPGLTMSKIENLIMKSPASTITIIAGCCHAGAFAENAAASQMTALRDRVTIMGSSLARQTSALEFNRMSVFTRLVVATLEGGQPIPAVMFRLHRSILMWMHPLENRRNGRFTNLTLAASTRFANARRPARIN